MTTESSYLYGVVPAGATESFGPIGLDYAYGFDKTEPGWQLHFNLGGGAF